MKAIADLSNSSKHWQITHPNTVKNQVIREVHESAICDYYAYCIAGLMVYVDFDNYRLSILELVWQVLGYFKWIFKDGDIAFPVELLDQLERCRIRQHSV